MRLYEPEKACLEGAGRRPKRKKPTNEKTLSNSQRKGKS